MKYLCVFLMLCCIAAHSEITNFGKAIEGVYRGGRINTKENYAILKDLNVKTIITLEYFLDESEKYCKVFNFECLEFPIFLDLPHSDIFFSYSTLKEAFREVNLARLQNKVVYIHCYHGSDRTGALASALRIRQVACIGDYDKVALRKEIDTTLTKYKFNAAYFPTLRSKILDWTQNVPKWICGDY